MFQNTGRSQYSCLKPCPIHVAILLLVSGSEPRFKVLFPSPLGTLWYIKAMPDYTLLSAGMNQRWVFLSTHERDTDAVGMYGAIEVASTEEVKCLVLSFMPGNGGDSSCTKSPTMMQILFPTKCLMNCKALLSGWPEEKNCCFLTLSPVLSS